MVALGLLSIVSFGSWFYGFGVLVEPIREATGWSESVLGGAFGGSLLLTGVGATLAGRILDHRGSRALFAGAAVSSGGLLLLTSVAGSPAVFLVAAVPAGGVIGGAGYYHATQAVVARLAPDERARGMTALTLWGAFASPVFLPLMGWLVASTGWRPTMRLVAAVVAAAFAFAAVAVPDVRPHVPPHPLRKAVGTAARDPAIRAVFLAALAAGAGTSLLLLYQVPAMVDAGLALTLASTLAGARGLLQLGGRLPLPWAIRRVGARRTLRGSYLLTAIGALLLTAAGNLAVALAFTMVAGVAIGALAAVEGIYAAEVVDEHSLGTLLGVHSLLRGIGSAIAPVIGGVVVDATGSRSIVLVGAAGATVAAAAMLPRRASSSRGGAEGGDDRTPSPRPADT